MIVRILSCGASFKGCAAYLTHDPEAETKGRVAWTHTLNLANDHVPSAVDEMLWTARDAELLKQEAGIRAGGRATENPVKHLSLNWSPEDNPTRQHMIETTEEFLRHMKWQEHQAIVVAHDDKTYRHVHVMLNMVHPETGLRLDDNFERRRAQAWALEYEREQGRVYCEQRLKNPEERENAPPRNMWTAFRDNEKKFEQAEKSLEKNEPIFVDEQKNQKNAEWKILKEIQRTERTDFFAEGKSEFSALRSSIYREVREEFRDRWADFYAAQRGGADADSLAAMKAELIADQKAVLEARRDEACNKLRESRDERYRALLADQREVRADLRSRQEAGLDNAFFLQEIGDRKADTTVTAGFREAADQAATPQRGGEWEAEAARPEGDGSNVNARSPADAHIDAKLRYGVRSFLDSLFCDLVGPGPKPYQPEPAEVNLFRAAAEDAVKQQQQHEREKADEEYRERHRSPGE
jgi:Relaxase/Mobilisation nuclease domain